MKYFETELDKIYNKYKIEYLDFHDYTNSKISERNNETFKKSKKEELRKELILKSIKFKDLDDSKKDSYISGLLLSFSNL